MTSENLKKFITEFGIFENKSHMLKFNDTKSGYDLVFSQKGEIDNRINAINQKTSHLFNYLRFFDINENKMSDNNCNCFT